MATPGGGTWLLHHELRLAWRGFGGIRLWILLIGGGVLWTALHLAAWSMLRGLANIDTASLPPLATAIAGGVFWLVASIMLSQSMAHSVAALFVRGDLDLLLSSPLSPRAVFMVRGVGIAVAASLLPAFMLLPFAHVGVAVGRPGLLAIYPVVASVALVCAAAGMALTMTLVKLFGARRAKTIAQIAAALIGAGFFLLSQLQSILPRGMRDAFTPWLRQALEPGGVLGPESAWWWPVRAMQGELLPLLAVMLVAVGAFWLVVNLTWRRFASGMQESVSGGRARVRRAADSGAPVFRAGLTRVLLAKEWKLLVRDPQIISQTLLQVLYLVPMIFIGFRSDRTAWLLIPGFVVMAAMLAGNLAWLTIAAEDAPELVGIAPVSLTRIRVIKALAAVLPVLALLLPLVVWWSLRAPAAATVLLLCSLGAMASAATCHIWNPRRGDRRDMKKRYKESGLVNILETLGSFGWAAIAACLNGYLAWLPLAIAVAAIGPGSAWLLGRAARQGGALA